MTTLGDETSGQTGDTTITTSSGETGQTRDDVSMEITAPDTEISTECEKAAPSIMSWKSDTSAKLSLMQTKQIKALQGRPVDIYITADTRQGLKQIDFVEEDGQFTPVGFITLTDKYLTDLTAL